MVFVSQNPDYARKCKWCDKPAEKYFDKKNGRFKSYYLTCGDPVCKTEQYRNRWICVSKGKAKNLPDFVCCVCEQIFTPDAPGQKKYCRTCVPNNAWRARAARYGVGKPQWDAMLLEQDFKCKLCDRNAEVVDHCYITQRIRGILCNHCNTQIAKMDNDLDWLKKAMTYIGVENVPDKISRSAYLHAKKPELAKEFEKKTPKGAKLPKQVKKK
jgi:hypothetical protein